MTRLAEDAVRNIFLQRPVRNSDGTFVASAELSRRLAREYGVAERSIREIWNRKVWVNITRPLWTDAELADNIRHAQNAANEADSTEDALRTGESSSSPAGVATRRRVGRPKGSTSSGPSSLGGGAEGGQAAKRSNTASPEVGGSMSATARECWSVGDGLAPSVVASSVELHKAAPLCAPAAARPWDAEKTERWLEEVRQARGGGLCDPFEQDWEAVLQSVDQTTMLGFSELQAATLQDCDVHWLHAAQETESMLTSRQSAIEEMLQLAEAQDSPIVDVHVCSDGLWRGMATVW